MCPHAAKREERPTHISAASTTFLILPDPVCVHSVSCSSYRGLINARKLTMRVCSHVEGKPKTCVRCPCALPHQLSWLHQVCLLACWHVIIAPSCCYQLNVDWLTERMTAGIYGGHRKARQGGGSGLDALARQYGLGLRQYTRRYRSRSAGRGRRRRPAQLLGSFTPSFWI